MYISAAERVPAEVEGAIDALDEVSQCAVIGVPDRKWGEVGLALNRARPGQSVDPERVLAHCRERLARLQGAAAGRIVESLP